MSRSPALNILAASLNPYSPLGIKMQGANARARGKGLDANPYGAKSIAFTLWHEGWNLKDEAIKAAGPLL